MPRGGLVSVALAAAAWLVVGCRPVTGQRFAQPGDVVWTVGPADTGSIPHDQFPLSSITSSHSPGIPWPSIGSFRPRTPSSKLHPDLRPLLRTRDTSSIELVIDLRDRSVVPRFPFERVEPGQDPLQVAGGVSTIDSLRDTLAGSRQRWYPRQRDTLESRFGARVRAQYVLTQSLLALVPRNRLRDLAGWDEVMSVSPARVRSSPPQNAPASSILGAAGAVGLDHFRDQGFLVGRMRLLDTGVDGLHDHLEYVDRQELPVLRRTALLLCDCVYSPTCSGMYTGDCQAYPGHGTASAGILVSGGTDAAGAQVVPANDRGVTEAKLQSCRVWDYRDPHMYYDVPAIKAALFDSGLPAASVIAIEVQSAEGSEGVIANNANAAYAAGAVVVAPIGNAGASMPNNAATGPQSPGSARKVLGVGARESSNLSTIAANQSCGAVHGATKPEVQFPTSTMSPARPLYSSSAMVPYGQTSGATPYAAAAALGMRSYLRHSASVVDPGQVYAALVACGQEVRPRGAGFPAESGAGLIMMPKNSKSWFGLMQMASGGSRTISLPLSKLGMRRLRVGLWWADPNPIHFWFLTYQPHVDFDLRLTPPAGQSSVSLGVPGCFERISYDPEVPTEYLQGQWSVTVVAANTGLRPATVYWAVFALP